MFDRAIYLLIQSVASSIIQLYGCCCIQGTHFWLPNAYVHIIGACVMIAVCLFLHVKNRHWSAFSRFGCASANTHIMYYHDSDAIVIIAHFCLVNCVKNAGLTPFNSTYFAHLANFEYKRRYDYPEHSTNVFPVWPYTSDRVPKAFFFMWTMPPAQQIGTLARVV